MKFCSITSGSKGNCQYIETENAKILIDAGLSGKAIEKNLLEIGVNPADLDAIFVTHEHSDHIKGVGILARRYQLDVFGNENTWLAMERTVKQIDGKNQHRFVNDEPFTYKDIEIYPLSTFHDCVQGTGFILTNRDKKISLLTDTGYVNTHMVEKMAGSDLYFIEANHDKVMLQNGPYSRALKDRISSTRGHLSNDLSGEVLSLLLEKRMEYVLLAHLSDENNRPSLASRTVRESLARGGIYEGVDFIMEVTKPYINSNVITL